MVAYSIFFTLFYIELVIIERKKTRNIICVCQANFHLNKIPIQINLTFKSHFYLISKSIKEKLIKKLKIFI